MFGKIGIKQYKEIFGTCCLLSSKDACCSMFMTPCLIRLSHPYYLRFPSKTFPHIIRFILFSRLLLLSLLSLSLSLLCLFLLQFTRSFAFCSFALSFIVLACNDVLRVRFDQYVMARTPSLYIVFFGYRCVYQLRLH